MRSLFKNTGLQEQFDAKGYLVLPLLQEPQIRNMLALYHQHIEAKQVSGLYESSRSNTYEVNQLIHDAILESFRPACNAIFSSVKLYGGTFMVKSCSDSEVLPLHQDWSVVEEGQYNTFFIWCPLQAVRPENGGLYVLEHSHRYFEVLRSGTYPSNRYILPPALHQFTKDIYLQAGEAILYSDQLFHGSYANNAAADRVVVTARVMEEEACLVYFHKANDKEVAVYEASPTFYLTQIDRIAKGQQPQGIPKLYSRPYQHIPVTDESLQAKICDDYHYPKNNSEMNGQIFQDPDLQQAFDRDGYVVIDLINEQQVEELRRFYQNLDNSAMPEYGFQVSLDNESPEFVRNVSQKLIQTVRSDLDKYFKDHQIFTASFVVKEENPKGVVPPHQDWTFVDELKYWSATIWCPLVDVNMDNGALGVIKGSHRFYDHVRPSPSPQYAPPFSEQLFSIFPYLNIINLKAGQALVFNNKTLHGSPPNTTQKSRVAFGIGITHRDAAIRHYYLLPYQEQPVVECFEVGPDFFYHYNNARLSAMYDEGEKPKELNSIGLFQLLHREYPTDQLVANIKGAGNTMDRPLMEKMAALFEYNLDGSKKEVSGNRVAQPIDEAGHLERLPFWKVYTPINIYREIKCRLTKSK